MLNTPPLPPSSWRSTARVPSRLSPRFGEAAGASRAVSLPPSPTLHRARPRCRTRTRQAHGLPRGPIPDAPTTGSPSAPPGVTAAPSRPERGTPCRTVGVEIVATAGPAPSSPSPSCHADRSLAATATRRGGRSPPEWTNARLSIVGPSTAGSGSSGGRGANRWTSARSSFGGRPSSSPRRCRPARDRSASRRRAARRRRRRPPGSQRRSPLRRVRRRRPRSGRLGRR